MRYVYWARTRAVRLLVILLAVVFFFLFLAVDDLRYFPHFASDATNQWLPWIHFGFSAFVALMFLAVGALVWLYARSRRVAFLLFCFSFAMMATFASQTSAAIGDPLLSTIGTVASQFALYLLATLLLFFPKNYFSLLPPSSEDSKKGEDSCRSSWQPYYSFLLWGYVFVLMFLAVIGILYNAFYYFLFPPLSGWLNALDMIYDLIALTGVLITIVVSYRQSSSLRERQQLRLFVSGVILAVAPLLLLTVLPKALSLPAQYAIDPQLSTITIGLFPVALGYTILRYQVLVFDMYIRQAVAWIVGSVGLALLGYIVFTFTSILLSKNVPLYVLSVVGAMALLAPCVWWLAHMATERLFFSEILYYRRLVASPDIMASETFDLKEASRLITLATVSAFETQEVCLFVLDEDTGCYQLYPPLKEGDPSDEFRCPLLQRLLSVSRQSSDEGKDFLEANGALIKRISSARRPLMLSEAAKADAEMPTGLARYLTSTTPLDSTDPLLAPVRAQGKLIGVLVLGERGDHQQYAGPDFEAIYLLLARFSLVLETARLYAQAGRHVAILNTLYGASTMPVESFDTIDEVASAYIKVAAEAVSAGAEIWLYHDQDHILQRVLHAGTGPYLIYQNTLTPSQAADWSTYFYQGDSQQIQPSWQEPFLDVPPCLPRTPSFPFAWIPLSKGQYRLGILVLTYPRPHHFSHEEKRVLEMFASQCTVALENAGITIELRDAYERQKELDLLKDQFIITASHELRTPLTAVQGYIELLETYNSTLSSDVRSEFIAKAHRGCDELTLMVGNIMDASRVQLEAENVKLSPVSLAESVYHVLEILEAMTIRENRIIRTDIPSDVLVMAENVRLRQVLLNLVSNALKYSPLGSGIEFNLGMDDKQVTIRIRDHGLGVPLADQERLFERFVRLERDMNSPMRGAGLGLYISKQLVEAMGGRIWVESTGIAREGSTFAFTLNRAQTPTAGRGQANAPPIDDFLREAAP